MLLDVVDLNSRLYKCRPTAIVGLQAQSKAGAPAAPRQYIDMSLRSWATKTSRCSLGPLAQQHLHLSAVRFGARDWCSTTWNGVGLGIGIVQSSGYASCIFPPEHVAAHQGEHDKRANSKTNAYS